MERFKRLLKNRILLICFSIFTSVGVVCSCMLPSFAVTIDGDEYDLITISQQDLLNMFNSGDLTVSYRFYSNNNSSHNYGSFFQMNNGLTLNPPISSSSPFTISSSQFNITAVGSDQVMVYAPYAFYAYPSGSDDLYIDFSVSFPFSGYADSQTYKFWYFVSGTVISSSTTIAGLLGQSQQFISSGSSSPGSVFWKDVPALQTFYTLFNRLPSTVTYDSVKSLMTYSVRSPSFSGHKEVDNISFMINYSTINTSGTPAYWAPVAFVLETNFQLYLPHDESQQVTDYLALIGSDTPTAQQQSELNALRSSFADKKSKMNEWADDLHVEVPDRPGLDELPTVEIDGEEVPIVDVVNEVSQTVVSPLFNYNIVTILVSSVLGISFIKILLFGSGEA